MNTTTITSDKKTQKWSKFIHQTPFKKYSMKPKLDTNITNEKIATNTSPKEESNLSWLSLVFCGVFSGRSLSEKNENQEEQQQQQQQQQQSPAMVTASPSSENFNAITTSAAGCLPLNKASNQQEAEKTSCSSISSNRSHEKDIVPLRQFLRYSMDRSDRRTFQRRRITQPFQPMYEIEWQKNQWLQFDNSTNKQIEHLRKNGFSKIAIRKDEALKKHIMYDNPSEFDVLLELSLHENSKDKNEIGNELEPILCHQPSQFSVRRTRWWCTSYEIGEAHLPNWVDPDLCCNAVMMDAQSVMAAMTNYSRTSLGSIQQNSKFPDTPAISQKSSVAQLSLSSSLWSIKPLQYTEPPFLLDRPVLSTA